MKSPVRIGRSQDRFGLIPCLILTLILVLGATLRFWSIRFGLPLELTRPDEEVIVGRALAVFSGDLNPHFFGWPTLFIYVTTAAYAILFNVERTFRATTSAATFIADNTVDPSTLYLITRGMAACAGVMTIAVLYAAASELFSRRASLVAAAFLAVAFLHVRDSHFGVPDVPVTLVTVCAFWAGVRCATKGATVSRIALAGLLCGLAASTKYNAALVLAPCMVAIVHDVMEARRGSTVRAMGAVALLFLCGAVGFFAGTPFALLDHHPFIAEFLGDRQRMFEGHEAMLGRGWTHQLVFSLRYGLSLPLLLTAITGSCWLLVRGRMRAALVLAFPVTYYVAIGAGLTVFPRYMVPIVPFLCMTAGFLVDGVADLAGETFRFAHVSSIFVIALAALIGIPTMARSVAFDRLMSREDTRVPGTRWIEERFPSGASMYQTGIWYGYLQPRPADRYPQYTFDQLAGRFELDRRPTSALPDVVVVLESPLVSYSPVPDRLSPILDAGYVLTMTFNPSANTRGPELEALYDQQDAFYVPYSGFGSVRRPGPNVSIFVRRHP